MPSFSYLLRDLDEPHPEIEGTARVNGIPVGRVIDYHTDHMGVNLVIVEHEHVTLGGRPLDIGSELAEYRSMVATALVNEFARNPHTTVRSLADYLQVTYSAARGALQNGTQAIEFALIPVSPEALHELGESFMVPRPPPPADDTPEDYYQLRVRLAAHLIQEYRENPEGPTVHWMADTFGITESDARHSLDRELREGSGLAQSFLFFREDLVAGMAQAMAPRPLTGQTDFIPSFVTTPADPRAMVRTPITIPEELKAPQGTHPTFGMELPKGELPLDILYEMVDKVQRTFPHFSRESVEQALRAEVERQGVSLGAPKSLWDHLVD